MYTILLPRFLCGCGDSPARVGHVRTPVKSGTNQQNQPADLLNAMAEMLWEIREYTENMEDMERFLPSFLQIAP
jgi:hypothetical protein